MLAEAVFVVTAYATGCDTKPGARTRAGTLPVVGFTAASDPRVLSLGSVVVIEGLGERQVHDTGGAVRGRHLDVFVDSCREARLFGRQRRHVRVVHVGGAIDRGETVSSPPPPTGSGDLARSEGGMAAGAR